MCPYCKQDAPLVFRNMQPRCAACGAPRAPLSHRILNLAGRPSQVGGTVANVVGWVLLTVGLLIALLLGSLFQAIFPAGIVGWVVGLPLGLISLAVGVLLIRGGHTLRHAGTWKERATREQAIFALAEHRGGSVTAADVAQSQNISPEEADALLTDLAKEQSDRVKIEVSEQGDIYYEIKKPFRIAASAASTSPRVRLSQEENPSITNPNILEEEEGWPTEAREHQAQPNDQKPR